ncbi:MAG TPA: hypothetical protein PLJ27_09715 [Polyangiaceae bacterium]|jgi:hypothetical protein|nr:MAG: hypothetical protein BWY17_03218 [Deltaproteobacteria bacterium ADurb.Bin207]HNS97672.1 hypothetical protein [Polyangiaceae bacterium]HNZ24751.1 hypothetical protein [Polyangiaceae bacterium]HOE51628.1 hypothetical protein [Polyangiaceae bacterium]HOH02888.1 hypothetical protein [Polyangiaceae bacterium]
MRWNDVGDLAMYRLHLASGGNLAGAILPMLERRLQVHLFAVRATDGMLSIAILGLDQDGTSRSYAEVVLTDLDAAGRAAWWIVRADDVVDRARVRLAEVDAILRGEVLPEREIGGLS